MKRADWFVSQNPREMLFALLKIQKDGRKFRLFACACCRSVWHLLLDSRSRRGVDTAEALADAIVSESQAFDAYTDAAAVYSEASPSAFGSGFLKGVGEAAQAVPVTLLHYESPQNAQRHASIVSYHTISAATLAEVAAHPAGLIADYARTASKDRESSIQANLLRDIFGNPFRPVAVEPGWLTSDVLALATGIYTEKAFDRLPILADALQDAGCNSDELLSHLRSDTEHVKGCWALDLVLGKS